MGGGDKRGDFSPSPHCWAVVYLLASSHLACQLDPGVGKVVVGCGVVGGYDGGV